MYQKGIHKSSNIDTLVKSVTLYAEETYPDIEKDKGRERTNRKLLNCLLINVFNFNNKGKC
jgi:hypothetical protein